MLATEYQIFELTRMLGDPNKIYDSTKKMKGKFTLLYVWVA